MVGVTDGWKCHPTSSWPYRHAQSITRWLWCGIGVTHHQTLSLQHDWLCVILATDLWWPPVDKKQQSNKEDATGNKVEWRGRRWMGHSSKWGWTLRPVRSLMVVSLPPHRGKSSETEWSPQNDWSAPHFSNRVIISPGKSTSTKGFLRTWILI